MPLSSTDEPIVLTRAPVSVDLTAPDDPARPSGRDLAARLLSLPHGTAIYILLEGLRTQVAPGITYNLYLGLPEGAPAAGPGDRHHVGTLSFFNAFGQSAESGGATAAFDVTGLALSLAEVGALGDGLPLRIEPAGHPAPDAEPVIGRISLIAR